MGRQTHIKTVWQVHYKIWGDPVLKISPAPGSFYKNKRDAKEFLNRIRKSRNVTYAEIKKIKRW